VAEHDFGIGPVTISLGVCSAGAEYDRDALLAAADAALYEAKAAGRNRVRVRRLDAPDPDHAVDRRTASTPARSTAPRSRCPAEAAPAAASRLRGAPGERGSARPGGA
jgi:hypothetical protein